MKVLVYGNPKDSLGFPHWFEMDLSSSLESTSEEILTEVYEKGAEYVFSVKLSSGRIVLEGLLDILESYVNEIGGK